MPLGLAARWVVSVGDASQIVRSILAGAILTSALTLFLMTAVWRPAASMTWNDSYDFEDLGIAMILFERQASLVAWLFLLIIVSRSCSC